MVGTVSFVQQLICWSKAEPQSNITIAPNHASSGFLRSPRRELAKTKLLWRIESSSNGGSLYCRDY